MRYGSLFLITLLIFSAGCSRVPKPATYPMTYQKKMQAAHHWDVLAADVAYQTAQYMATHDTDMIGGTCLYVESQKGVFGRAFTKLLISHLVKNGVAVAHTKGRRPELTFDAQVIKHVANRFDRRHLGTYTALAGGIYVLRHITWDTLTFLGVPAATVLGDIMTGSETTLPAREVLITTSISNRERYLLYNTDLYYLNDKDWWHYTLEDIPEPEDAPPPEDPSILPVKRFEITDI